MSVVTMTEARARNCYDFKFIETAIKHTEENSNQEAPRKYSVNGTPGSI